jgi:hypothetical protein
MGKVNVSNILGFRETYFLFVYSCAVTFLVRVKLCPRIQVTIKGVTWHVAATSSDIGWTLHLAMGAVLLEYILAISWSHYYSNRRLSCFLPQTHVAGSRRTERPCSNPSCFVACHEDLSFFSFCFCDGDQIHSFLCAQYVLGYTPHQYIRASIYSAVKQ